MNVILETPKTCVILTSVERKLPNARLRFLVIIRDILTNDHQLTLYTLNPFRARDVGEVA